MWTEYRHVHREQSFSAGFYRDVDAKTSLTVFVGIRRKRLKGDTWAYKKICEDILKEADL